VRINEIHRLVIEEGEDFKVQEITPHPRNFDSNPNHTNPEPEFIIMHYTTGTEMASTINTFTNPPKDSSSGVSTHLLVGRDGSVVQFLRFDQIAYHCGFSWWEQQSNLNTSSIGIELANAGSLIRKDNTWQRKNKMIIPDEEVQQHEYWKGPVPDDKSKLPGWQKFTDVQLAVALKIVQALVEKYPSIKEILGHDEVNLALRQDPGPLLPREEWRKILFGREQPKIEEYLLNHQTDLYANVEGRLPNTQSTFNAHLPAKSLVSVEREDAGFALVTVIKSKDPTVKGRGWIQSKSLEDLPKNPGSKEGKKKNAKVEDKRRTTTFTQPFFKAGEGPPTLKVGGGLFFHVGTRVRIQEFRGEWALVAMLDRINGLGEVDKDHGLGGLEGWMHKEFLSRKDE
jgi:N-acetylmuramoyl-L-alanine amidase